MKHTNRNTRRGFTLVEMLIVLAILVGLAAMVVPRLLGTQKKADISNAKAQIGMIKGCLQNYFLDMKNFPTTEQGLDALVAAPAGGDEGTETVASSNWNGPYTESGELPVDPWGNSYQYAYPPTHSKSDTPDIWSFGPDGQDNTEDDITSWTREAGEGGTEGGGEFSEYDDYQEAPPAAEPQP